MNVSIHDFNKRFGTTHKRVGIEEYIDYALENNADTISVISSGNLFMELKSEIERRSTKIKLVNLVNESYKNNESSINIQTNMILRDATEREEYLAEIAKLRNETFGKVVDVTDFLPKALEEEAEEILKTKPDYVAVPIGSGKNFISIYRKIKELKLNTKLIGFMPKNENGIFPQEQIEEDGKLFFKNFSPRSKADKLVTPYVLKEYQQEILQAQKEGHILYEMNNSEEEQAIIEARRFEIKTEPSSATAFYALTKKFRKKQKIDEESDIVIVNTGQGTKEYDVVNISISPLKKLGKAITIGIISVILPYLMTPSIGYINNRMKAEFYSRQHPEQTNPMKLLPCSSLDYLIDERNAFMFGTTENTIYLDKQQAIKLAKEGEQFRKQLTSRKWI